MKFRTYDIFVNPNYFHVKHPDETIIKQIYCLIHGWSGNEKSMTIFSSSVPMDALIIFPRGPLQIGENEFAWADIRKESKPTFEDYGRIATDLIKSIDEFLRGTKISSSSDKINLMGFSQGAAISVVLSVLFPEKFNKVAVLSGFLPSNPPTLYPKTLSLLNYYIAHGTQDQLVEFDKSIKLKKYLEQHGAEIQFCQEDLGHKIGASCLRNLKRFYQT